MVHPLPFSGTSSTNAKEAGTRSIDAVKRKITLALNFAVLAGQPIQPPSGQRARIKDDKGVMDLWWNDSIAELVVAFQVPNSVLTKVSGPSGQPNCLAGIRKLKLKEGDGEVQVAPSLTGVLDNFLNAEAFKKIRRLCGDKQPRRVICTGFGVGGSVATVAAVLLAVDYPLANVRCVTVDSPIVTYGSRAFASLYRFLIAFSCHINTNGLLVFEESAKPFPLYGQFVKKEGELQTKIFDPTAEPNGNEVSIEKLISDLVVGKDNDSRLVTKEDTANEKIAEFWHGIEAQIRDAAASWGKPPPDMEKDLESLYAADPTSREVSLAWTDEAVTAPFSKPLDTVEKLLLVKNRVPALAGMAAAAYKDEKSPFGPLRFLLGQDGFVETTGISKLYKFVNKQNQLNGQCYVVWRPAINTLIVAFRGTHEWVDWAVDLSATWIPFLESVVEGAQVHQGFYHQLSEMYDDIKEAITSLTAGASVEHIITTGHSLGGALATIGGPMLAKEFPGADVSVVSFAAPRAGNDKFRQAFATVIGSSMRFQYNYDAVPCVPFRSWGYTHVAGNSYLRPGLSRGGIVTAGADGIDEDAELDLYAEPPQEGDECYRAVGNNVIANHGMETRYIGSLVGYMQRLIKEENSRVRTPEV